MEGNRVDVSSRTSIAIWAHQLICTDAELEDAVEVAGDSLEAVREYLLAPPSDEPVTRPVWRAGRDATSGRPA